MPQIECLTLVLPRGMNGVTSAVVTLHGTPEDSAVFLTKKTKSMDVWAFLVVNHLDISEPLTTHHALAHHPRVINFS